MIIPSIGSAGFRSIIPAKTAAVASVATASSFWFTGSAAAVIRASQIIPLVVLSPTDAFALPFGIWINRNLEHALFRFVFAHMVSNEVPAGLLTGAGFVVLIRPLLPG